MAEKAKVFIACCNRLLRESIARILSKKTDLEVVAAQVLGSASHEEIVATGADILVLDSLAFLLEDMRSGSEVAASARAIAAVLVAMEDDHNHFLTAVRRGARGYILQDASAADVMGAIRAVADGQVSCPPGYINVLFNVVATQTEELPNSQRRAKWGLTRREQQLIPLIGRGLSNKEIANYLSLSEQTVKNHIHRIVRKTGVSNRLHIFEACQNQMPASGAKGARYST